MIEENLKILLFVRCKKDLDIIDVLGQKNLQLSLDNKASLKDLIAEESYEQFNLYMKALEVEKFVFIPKINVKRTEVDILEANFIILDYENHLLVCAFSVNWIYAYSDFVNMVNNRLDVFSVQTSNLDTTNKNIESTSYFEDLTILNNQLINSKRELSKKNTEILEKLNSSLDLKNKLVQENDNKNMLFSIIAHDLKNPLSGIIGILELMKYKNDYTIIEKNYILDNLYMSSKSSLNLMENLFQWANAQKNDDEITPLSVDIVELAKKEIEILSVPLKMKNIELETDFEVETNAYIEPGSVSTVLRNLIYNSIKYTHENGKINVKIKEEKNLIEVSVIDNGVGMEQEKVSQLFTFNSASHTSGTKGEIGTGFGLSVCKSLIEMNKGNIFVSSTLGKGTNFTFSVPKASSIGNL